MNDHADKFTEEKIEPSKGPSVSRPPQQNNGQSDPGTTDGQAVGETGPEPETYESIKEDIDVLNIESPVEDAVSICRQIADANLTGLQKGDLIKRIKHHCGMTAEAIKEQIKEREKEIALIDNEIKEEKERAEMKRLMDLRDIAINNASDKVIKNPTDYKEIAEKYLSLRAHKDGNTVACWKGEVFKWVGPRWEAYEHEGFNKAIGVWLEGCKIIRQREDPMTGEVSFDEGPMIPDKKQVGEVEAAIKARITRDGDEPLTLDGKTAPMELLVVNNGILNMKTGKLRPHTPRMFNTVSIDANWVSEWKNRNSDALIKLVEGTAWSDFLENVFEHDRSQIDLLGEFMGYTLTPDTSQQKMLFMLGKPRAGKGTVMRIMENFMPDQTCATKAVALERGDLASAIGKHMMTWPDMRVGRRTDTSTCVEALLSISGEDSQDIFRKYLPSWRGKLAIKIWIAANTMPRLDDPSGTAASRFIILTFPKSNLGNEDPKLTEKIWTNADLILAWMIGHWRKLMARGKFSKTNTDEEIRMRMQARQDITAPFFRELVDETGNPSHAINAEEAYLAYCQCAQRYGVIGITKTTFTQTLGRRDTPIMKKRRNLKDHHGETTTQIAYVGLQWEENPKQTAEQAVAGVKAGETWKENTRPTINELHELRQEYSQSGKGDGDED